MATLSDIMTKGSTDRSVTLRIIDATDGTPETGVTFETAGINLWYRREGAAKVSVTEVVLAALTTAHADGGFLHISDGEYRFDLPDAAFATGVNYVDFGGTVTGMVVIGGRVRLTDFNLEVATQPTNAIQISGDATAADNLESTYDGTGYADPQAPATQEALGTLSVGAGGLGVDAYDATIVTGSETLTYTATHEQDGIVHLIEPDAGNTTVDYLFNVTELGSLTSFDWRGYVKSNGDSVTVQAYNDVTSSYVTLDTIPGSNSSTFVDISFDQITTAMTGTGANLGEAILRFTSTSSTEINTDRLRAVYTATPGGIANGTTVTLTETTTNKSLIGNGWTLVLNSQIINGSYFEGSKHVSGTATSVNGSEPTFNVCHLHTASLSADVILRSCEFEDTLTITSTAGVTADSLRIHGGSSDVSGAATPEIDMSGVTKTTSGSSRKWGGGCAWIINSFCTVSHEVLVGGAQIITNAAGAFELRGIFASATITSTGSAVTNIHAVTGVITIEGSGGTVNVTGHHAGIVDNSGATVTINDNAAENDGSSFIDLGGMSTGMKAEVNAEADTALADYDGPTKAEMDTAHGLLATEAKQDANDANVILILADTGTAIPALIATMQNDLDIITDTDGVIIGAAAVDLIWDEDILKVNHDVPNSGARYVRTIKQSVVGAEGSVVVGATPTATNFDTDLTEADGLWDDAVLVFTSGVLTGQGIPISTYLNANGNIDTNGEAFIAAPANGDEFLIQPGHVHPIDQIADGVLSRSVSNVEATAGSDTLCELILGTFHTSAISAGTWTIKRTDNSTTFSTVTITTSGTAELITSTS